MRGSELSIYYTLPTWNPYVVILVKTQLKIGGRLEPDSLPTAHPQ